MVYKSPLSVEKPEKVIVPEEVNPVKPVRVPAAIRLAPLAVKAVVPPGESCTSPVELFPKVRVCALVVPNTPAPVRKAALLPELADTEAVGVPEFMFKTANLAEDEAWEPSKKSRVDVSFGVITPFTMSQLDPAPAAQEPQAAVAPPKRHCADVPAVPPKVIPPLARVNPVSPVKVPVAVMLPLLAMVNLVVPEAEAVKISFTPCLLTINPA